MATRGKVCVENNRVVYKPASKRKADRKPKHYQRRLIAAHIKRHNLGQQVWHWAEGIADDLCARLKDANTPAGC